VGVDSLGEFRWFPQRRCTAAGVRLEAKSAREGGDFGSGGKSTRGGGSSVD
jgi:hypothetical protein